jgi:hypothetical protein
MVQAWADLEAAEGHWDTAKQLLDKALAVDQKHLPSWLVSKGWLHMVQAALPLGKVLNVFQAALSMMIWMFFLKLLRTNLAIGTVDRQKLHIPDLKLVG